MIHHHYIIKQPQVRVENNNNLNHHLEDSKWIKKIIITINLRVDLANLKWVFHRLNNKIIKLLLTNKLTWVTTIIMQIIIKLLNQAIINSPLIEVQDLSLIIFNKVIIMILNNNHQDSEPIKWIIIINLSSKFHLKSKEMINNSHYKDKIKIVNLFKFSVNALKIIEIKNYKN